MHFRRERVRRNRWPAAVVAKLTQTQTSTHSAVVRSGKTDTNQDVLLVTRNAHLHMYAQNGSEEAMIEPLGIDDWCRSSNDLAQGATLAKVGVA